MTVDIALGFDVYSAEELQNYASNGLLYAGNVDLTRFVEKLLEGMYSQEELDKAVEEAEDETDFLYCAECGEMM
jgi:hypothetical protein